MIAAFAFAALLLASTPAQAYIGPAIAVVGYIAGPVVAVIAAVALILSYPAMALWRKYKKKKAGNEKDAKSPLPPGEG